MAAMASAGSADFLAFASLATFSSTRIERVRYLEEVVNEKEC